MKAMPRTSKDPVGPELLEDVLFRESETLPGTVKERRAAIFPCVPAHVALLWSFGLPWLCCVLMACTGSSHACHRLRAVIPLQHVNPTAQLLCREFVGVFSSKKKSSSSKKAGKISKRWSFGGHASLDAPVLKTFSRLTKPTNKLWALMSGHYVQVELVSRVPCCHIC